MELCTAAARAPEFSWVRRIFFRDRRALNFATRRGSNFFDTFHFKTSFPNLPEKILPLWKILLRVYEDGQSGKL
jgi:hypothetical protein